MIDLKSTIRKMRISRILLWQIGVVAFLVFFVVILLLNVYIFRGLKDRITETDIDAPVRLKSINESLLEKTISKIEKRKQLFEQALRDQYQISDPSI